jgi:hypothetical protein
MSLPEHLFIVFNNNGIMEEIFTDNEKACECIELKENGYILVSFDTDTNKEQLVKYYTNFSYMSTSNELKWNPENGCWYGIINNYRSITIFINDIQSREFIRNLPSESAPILK